MGNHAMGFNVNLTHLSTLFACAWWSFILVICTHMMPICPHYLRTHLDFVLCARDPGERPGPGWPYRGLPPGGWLLFLKNYDHTLHQMCFCGYFVRLKVPNGSVIVTKPIFWPNFGQIGVFDPPGWPYLAFSWK